MTSFESYIREQEIAMMGVELDKVSAILREQPNKNQDCWLYSFGGKDADLDPEGCTGIKSLIAADDETIEIIIGGHKTVCPVDNDDSIEGDQMAQELVCGCGYSGEWTGEEWVMAFEGRISSPWVFTPDGGDIDYAATAEAAKDAARKACEPFSEAMQYIDAQLDELQAAQA